MNATAFTALLRNPTDRTVPIAQLEEAVLAYPWCQPLRAALSVRAYSEGYAARKEMLGQAAVHTFYRPKLRELVEAYQGAPVVVAAAKKKTDKAPEKKIDLMAEVRKEPSEHRHEELKPEELALKAKPARPAPIKDPAKTDDQARLIDDFLAQQEGVRVRRKDLPEETSKDLSAGSTRFDGLIISETMARMYMRQGQPEKAAYIVEKLSLKFPEKSAYFADILKSGGPEA